MKTVKELAKFFVATICTLFAILAPVKVFPQLATKEIYFVWCFVCVIFYALSQYEERENDKDNR